MLSKNNNRKLSYLIQSAAVGLVALDGTGVNAGISQSPTTAPTDATDAPTAVDPATASPTSTLMPTSKPTEGHVNPNELLEKVANCASVDLDANSCIVASTIALMLSPTPDTGDHETQYAESHRALTENLMTCEQPEIDEAYISYTVSEAGHLCSQMGAAIDEQEINDAIDTFLTVMSADQCWDAMCQHDDEDDQLVDDVANDVLDQVASCSDVHLDRESCLVSTTMDMLLSEASMELSGMGDRRSLQGIGVSDAGLCVPPELDEAMLSHFVSAASQECTDKGVEVSQEQIEETIVGVSKLFGASDCWEALCEQTNDFANDVIGQALDQVATCSEVDLDRESCLVSTTIDMFLAEAAMPLGGTTTGGHRSLLLSETGFCTLPELDHEMAQYIVSTASQKCSDQGVEVSQAQVEETIVGISQLFGASDCWKAPCEQADHALDDLIGQALDQVATCSGVPLDRDSCLVSTAIDIFLTEAATALGGMATGGGHRSLLLNEMGFCTPPELDDEMAHYVVSAASLKCADQGVEVSQEQVEETIVGVTRLFGASDCWESLCEQADDFVEDMIGQALDQVATCSEVYINRDSCLVSKSIDMFLSEAAMTLLGGPSDRRALQISDTGLCTPPEIDGAMIQYYVSAAYEKCVDMGQEMSHDEIETTVAGIAAMFDASHCWNALCEKAEQAVDTVIDSVLDQLATCSDIEIDRESCLIASSIDWFVSEVAMGLVGGPTNDMNGGHRLLQEQASSLCTPPQIDEETANYILANAVQDRCGTEMPPQEEVEKAVIAISKLFGASDCWESVCSQVKYEATKFLLERVASCSGEELDPASCLVSTTTELYISQAAAALEGQVDLCQPPQMEPEMVHGTVLAAQQKCASAGISFNENEVGHTVASFVNIFGAETCWNDLCPANHEDRIRDEIFGAADDAMAQFRLEYISDCAQIQLSQDSCIEASLLQMILSGDDAANDKGNEMRRRLEHGYNGTDGNATYAEYGEFGREEPHHDDLCAAPEVDVHFMVDMAKGICMASGLEVNSTEVEGAIEKLTALAGAETCWASLCTEQVQKLFIGHWMGQCANIQLPFSISNHPKDVAEDPGKYVDDDALACMLNHVMTVDPSDIGLPIPDEGSLDVCYPPGHYDIKSICPAILAPAALKNCTMGDPKTPEYPPIPYMSMSYDHGDMSYGYWENVFDWDWDVFGDTGMSLSFDYGGGGGGGKGGGGTDPDREMRLIEDLCGLLEQLSSDIGKQCLLPLCDIDLNDFDITKDGEGKIDDDGDSEFEELESALPSLVPSSMPSIRPSVAMSWTPSASPSISPSTSPSATPSAHLISESPSSKPSAVPSAFPSSLPSITPANGIVEVKYEAGITVNNFDIADVPVTPGEELDAMVRVLRNVIRQFLPENADARILRIGGISVTARRLRRYRRRKLDDTGGNETDNNGAADASEGVDIEFEVIVKLECDDRDCKEAEEMSKTAYEEMTDEMDQAVTDGSLTAAIQEEASEEGVEALESIEVEPTSFKAQEPTTTVRKAQEDDDDDEDDSAGNALMGRHATTLAMVLSTMIALALA